MSTSLDRAQAHDWPPSSRRRLRAVVAAFTASPIRGSEAGIGWGVVSHLARYCDVTVLTCPLFQGVNYRDEVEQHLVALPGKAIPGLGVQWIEAPFLTRALQRSLISFATPLYFVGYAAWQRAASAEAARLHAERPFDIAHQLTFTGFREPGFLWRLGAPFVWGPIAGASNVPWAYFRGLSNRDRIFYGLKNTLNTLHKRFKRRPRLAADAARAIFAVTEQDRSMVARWGATSTLMLDTGTPPEGGRIRAYDGRRPLCIAWSGLHVGRKALPLLLHALARLRRDSRDGAVTLVVLGDGRLTLAWRNLAAQLGLNDMVRWTGQLPRQKALDEMRKADLFVLSSVQEGTSSVIMEALALGTPVICHDACGMGIAIDETCGVKVPLIGPDRSVEGLATAIHGFLEDPSRVRTLSVGALARARALTWDQKARDISAAYDGILAGRRC